MKLRCIACGHPITKLALDDPFMCRGCEATDGIEESRYGWLDK